MGTKKHIFFSTILVLMISTVSGCANRGSIWPQPLGKESLTIQKLQMSSSEYTISYTGSLRRPIAILFDLKNDDKKLVGGIWSQIENKENLSTLLKAVSSETAPFTIRGRKDMYLYGYVSFTRNTTSYYGSGSGGYSYFVVADVVDENTMDVKLIRYRKSRRPSDNEN